jgi:hypothetical protein
LKKIMFALLVLFMAGVGTGFAAPINNLGNGQTAIGFVSDDFYAEHKFTDNFTLGLQKNDIYGQVNLNGNLRAIVGSRDYNYNGSKLYVGAAVNTSLAPAWDGYASLIAGSGFKEMQVGVNYNLTNNVDVNINRTGIGATLKF